MAADGSGVGIRLIGSSLGGDVDFFFFKLDEEDFVGLTAVGSEAEVFLGLCIGSSGLAKALPEGSTTVVVVVVVVAEVVTVAAV